MGSRAFAPPAPPLAALKLSAGSSILFSIRSVRPNCSYCCKTDIDLVRTINTAILYDKTRQNAFKLEESHTHGASFIHLLRLHKVTSDIVGESKARLKRPKGRKSSIGECALVSLVL